MKHKLRIAVVISFLVASTVSAQHLFDSFEVHPDSVYLTNVVTVSGNSNVTITLDDNAEEGASSIRVAYQVEAAESWGGFAKWEFWNPDSGAVWDFSQASQLQFWFFNDIASSIPGRAHVRVQFYDVSDVPYDTYDANQTELWYSFHYLLDLPNVWANVDLPLLNVGEAALDGSTGFWQTMWAGVAGNSTLDLDQIKGMGIEFSMDGPNDFMIASGEILFDNFNFDGEFGVVDIKDDHAQLPQVFELQQNYPNPFNPTTTIRYSLAEASNVEVTVFDITGQVVSTLTTGLKPAGNHEVGFDATGLSSGVYFYSLKAGENLETRRMILTR